MTRFGPRAWAMLVLAAVAAIGLFAIAARDPATSLRFTDADLLAAPLDPDRPIDEHALWAIAWANGQDLDQAEYDQRFSATFAAQMPYDGLVVQLPQIRADKPYTVVGFARSKPSTRAVLVHGASGKAYVVAVALAEDRSSLQIAGLALTPVPIGGHPIGRDAVGLIAVAAITLAAAAVVAGNRSTWRSWLLGGASVAAVAQVGQTSANVTLFTIGLVSGPIALALAAHAAIDPSRSHQRWRRFVLPLVYLGAVSASLYLLVIETRGFGWPALPGFARNPSTATALLTARSILAIVAVIGVAMVVATGELRPSRMNPATPRAAGAIGAALLVALVAASWLVHPTSLTPSMSWLLEGALLVLAIGELGVAVINHLESSGVARFVTDLGDEPHQPQMPDALARALGDPTVEILYWSADADSYVTQAGDQRDLEALDAGRVVTRLQSRGAPLAAVVHDAARGLADQRVAAVCAATRLVLDNERLTAELRSRLNEVHASRNRLVEAADEARRRVERDLHDGVQQRLLALRLQASRAAIRASRREDLSEELTRLSAGLGAATDELRAIARGLHPPALDHGVVTAIEACAEVAVLPVRVSIPPDLREPGWTAGRSIDTAIYFVVAEAITNAGRHAEADQVEITLVPAGGSIMIDICDDGCGGALRRFGGGLQGLHDRVEALGGSLRIESPFGVGTKLRVTLPLPNGVI
jgi:signal transduction histidine kinase